VKKTFGLSVAYRPEASTATDPRPDDPGRGLTVYERDVHAYAAGERPRREQDISPDPMYAIIFQSQSTDSAARLAGAFVEIGHADRALRTVLFEEIFIHAEEVARLMGADPRLTIESAPVDQRLSMLDDAVRLRLEQAQREGAPGDPASSRWLILECSRSCRHSAKRLVAV
jgi:hypothetical protein